MRRLARIALGVGVVVLAAALRLPELDAQSLWSDEIYSVESARWPVPILVSVADGHPPLYGLALKAMDVVRPTDWNGRLISAMAGVATVAAMLGLGRVIANPRTAVLAALLLAIAPLHVWYSREGRMYALATFCSTGASWLFARALGGAGNGIWLGYIALSVAGLLTHYLYAPIVLAQVLFAALRRPAEPRATRRTAIACAAVLALAVLTLASLGGEALGIARAHRGFQWLALPYTAHVFVAGFGVGPPVALLHRAPALGPLLATYWAELTPIAVLGAALVWAALRAIPSLGGWGLYLVLWLALPAAVVFGGSWATGTAYNVRYLLPAFPAAVLLVAAGLDRAPRWYAIVCLTGLVAVAAISIGRDRRDPTYARDDLRGAAAYLRAHAGSARIAVSAAYIADGLRYYEPTLHLEPFVRHPVRTADDASAALGPFAATGGWFVLCRDWEDDPAGHVATALAASGAVEVSTLPGMRIFRLPPGA